MNSRQRVLAMFEGKAADHLPFMPITMQFAADRINRKYFDYATDHWVLLAGQLKVAKEFDTDHVSCISDPAREAADCGASIVFRDDAPPDIDERHALLADKTVLASLEIPDPHKGKRMLDRIKAAALFKQKAGLDKIIEGWVEGPCAEGADLRGINTIMLDFFEDPGFIRDLFEFVTQLAIRFAKAQIEAGVDLMGIGDAAASLVGPKIYEEFVWPFEKRLVDAIHQAGAAVRLHICGDTRAILEGMSRLGAEMADLDFPCPVALAREKMGPAQVICGNINPVSVLQDGDCSDVRRAIEKCHKEAGDRFIVGAGCEVTRHTPIENLRAMRDYALAH